LLQESTFTLMTLPAGMVVVQPVRVELWPFMDELIVGLAAAVMVSATVGSKLA
jgi:hypothetical protein